MHWLVNHFCGICTILLIMSMIYVLICWWFLWDLHSFVYLSVTFVLICLLFLWHLYSFVDDLCVFAFYGDRGVFVLLTHIWIKIKSKWLKKLKHEKYEWTKNMGGFFSPTQPQTPQTQPHHTNNHQSPVADSIIRLPTNT